MVKRLPDPEDGQLRACVARDTVAALYAKGALSDDMARAQAMKRAGEAFASNFWLAGMVGFACSSTERRSRGNGGMPTEEMVEASMWIDWALGLVGGADSLAGSVLWHVCGLGETLNAWAERVPVPAGAPKMRQSTATHVLRLALETVAAGAGREQRAVTERETVRVPARPAVRAVGFK